MSTPTKHSTGEIRNYPGKEADSLLNQECKMIRKNYFDLPGKDVIEKVSVNSGRNIRTLSILASIYNHGRQDGT